MSKRNRKRSRPDVGGNRSRVEGVQQLRRSGAAGAHKQASDLPRSVSNRGAIEEFEDDDYEDLED